MAEKNKTKDEAEAPVEAPEAEGEQPAEPDPAEALTEQPVAERTPEPEPAPDAEPAAEPEGASEPASLEAGPAEAAKQVRRKRLPRIQRRLRPKPKREPGKARKPIVRLPKPEHGRGREQERRGVVVSNATDKTIVVRVEVVKAHPRYKKIIRRSAKLHAHDERNAANVGDVVRIVETRPLSRTKRWRLAEILETAK
jgi:ribosomal protein uS17